jgi:hypothetical protein
MSELVERMRGHVEKRGGPTLNGAWAMMLEAADEIERLRALIAEIERRVMFEAYGTGNTFSEAVEHVANGGTCPTVVEAYAGAWRPMPAAHTGKP